jgi:hypothetical protein
VNLHMCDRVSCPTMALHHVDSNRQRPCRIKSLIRYFQQWLVTNFTHYHYKTVKWEGINFFHLLLLQCYFTLTMIPLQWFYISFSSSQTMCKTQCFIMNRNSFHSYYNDPSETYYYVFVCFPKISLLSKQPDNVV